MAEKEYIEREAAIDALTEQNLVVHMDSVNDGLVASCHRSAQRIIANIPAADVVEVRHGRWERVDYGNGLYNYHCSSCRHIPRENIRSNYCPNCGADMRGEQDG